MTDGVRLAPAPPWVAIVVQKTGLLTEQDCSGSVVGNGWVLTAAHCVYRSGQIASTNNLSVLLGRDDRGSFWQGASYSVTTIKVMPGYDPARNDGHDAALLRLSGFDPVRWHSLPLSFEPSAVNSLGGVTLVGYGNTGFDTTVTQDQTTDHEIGGGALWKSPDGAFVRDTSLDRFGFVCFGRTSTTQAMGGDSGAPWLRWISGAWQIIGVHAIVSSPLNAPGDHRVACGTSPLAPTSTGTTMIEWTRTTASLPLPVPNSMVRDPLTGQAWLIGADKYRRYLPNLGDYYCFLATGLASRDLPRIQIETIPDRVGTAATCTPPPAADGSQLSTNSWYEIRNVNSGLCVDTRGGAITDGTVVQQYTCNRTSSQQFRFVDAGGGYFQVLRRNAGSQSIDVKDRSSLDGAKVQTWTYVAGPNQRWWAESLGNGRWRFRPLHSGKCLNVPGATKSSGVQLQQYSCNGTTAQTFALTIVG